MNNKKANTLSLFELMQMYPTKESAVLKWMGGIILTLCITTLIKLFFG